MNKGSLLSAILLIAGTSIGGGMLGLPVITAEAGFFYTTFFYLLCWLFMASTGHLLMEIALYTPKEVNLISMAGMTLGKWGKGIAWLLYLYLFYSLTIAYLAGGGKLISYLSPTELPTWIQPLLFTLLFAPIVLIGPSLVGKINNFFMWGLFLAFFIFVYLGLSHIHFPNLQRANFYASVISTPILFTSFGFQGIVPTIITYLNRDAKRIKIAIWVGSFLPLLIYIVWEALILGVIPFDSLKQCKELGETAVFPLKNLLEKPLLYIVGKWFAFFAIVTSFFGVTLGLFDFFSDAFKISKKGIHRFLIGALVFLPPLILSLINPCLFLNALHYGGGLGCALLLGLLPILMTWSGRYIKGYHSSPLPGGKATLILLFLFVTIILTTTLLDLVL